MQQATNLRIQVNEQNDYVRGHDNFFYYSFSPYPNPFTPIIADILSQPDKYLP